MKRKPTWLREAAKRITPPPPGQPAILYYDIETAPQLSYQWGSGKYDTRPLKVVKSQYHLSVTYMWEGSDETHFVGLYQNPKFRPDYPWSKPKRLRDRWVLGEMWHLFDQADMTIAHNNMRFDLKRTNARLIAANVEPPRPSKDMDTLRMYRRIAKFTSNRLDELAREIGVEGKYHHSGLDVWWGCMEGDPEAWAEMETYNRQDVVVLRSVYRRILPWLTNNPGLNASTLVGVVPDIDGRPVVCPKPGCGGTRLIARGLRQKSGTGLSYRQWQCVGEGGCRGFSISRYAEKELAVSSERIK